MFSKNSETPTSSKYCPFLLLGLEQFTGCISTALASAKSLTSFLDSKSSAKRLVNCVTTLRIMGPSNGRVNEPLYQGCFGVLKIATFEENHRLKKWLEKKNGDMLDLLPTQDSSHHHDELLILLHFLVGNVYKLSFVTWRVDQTWRIIPVSKWLGSPLSTSHGQAIYKGNNPI